MDGIRAGHRVRRGVRSRRMAAAALFLGVLTSVLLASVGPSSADPTQTDGDPSPPPVVQTVVQTVTQTEFQTVTATVEQTVTTTIPVTVTATATATSTYDVYQTHVNDVTNVNQVTNVNHVTRTNAVTNAVEVTSTNTAMVTATATAIGTRYRTLALQAASENTGGSGATGLRIGVGGAALTIALIAGAIWFRLFRGSHV